MRRRAFLEATAAGTVLALAEGSVFAEADTILAARPPSGFVPFAAPGRVARVKKRGSLMPNQLYPKSDDAKQMLERVMTELTGKSSLVESMKLFVHPADKVCVKVNGVALHKMATNREFVLPLLDAIIAAGVPAPSITVLEQFDLYLMGTRLNASNVPRGVNVSVHENSDATMDPRTIPGTGVETRFARVLTESTALINVSLVKDHAIAGYTGALKNMTHGLTTNPSSFHDHHAAPQIALIAAQDVLTSRMRLHLADAFKVICHGGPLDTMPQYRIPYEAVMASTDPVAIDAVGCDIVEQLRRERHLPSLAGAGRPPAYIAAAETLGLGIAARGKIQLRDVTL
jgi:hypothetical protein